MRLESSDDPALRQAVIRFLLDTFHQPPDAPFVQPSSVRWKYDEPRPDRLGPRSFILREGDAIAAHGCLCPVTYTLPSGDITGCYLIDWAASRTFVGAGVKLLRALADQCDILFAVGGSADTRQILPNLGYRHIGDLRLYARVLRPWRQFRTDPFPRGWKAPARLARNATWSLAGMPKAPRDWCEQRIGAFEPSTQPLFDARADSAFLYSRRTPELMNYYLRCPSASFSAALLLRAGVPLGWYVLSRVGGQVRIADLWVNSNSPGDWSAAYALAGRAACSDPESCELVATASIPPAVEAMSCSGLRFHHSEPIFVLDPRKTLDGSKLLNVSFLESDLAYGTDPNYPYLT